MLLTRLCSNFFQGQQGSLVYNGSCYGTGTCSSGAASSIYAAAYLLQGGPAAICPYVRRSSNVLVDHAY